MQIDDARALKKSKIATLERFRYSKADLPHPRCQDVREYLIYLCQRTYVTFKPRFLSEEGIRVELATNMQYDDIVTALGRALHVDPFHIRLYKAAPGNRPSQNSISRQQAMSSNVYLPEYLRIGQAETVSEMYFEVLDYSILELDHKFPIDIKWFNQSDLSVEPLVVLVPIRGGLYPPARNSDPTLQVKDFLNLICEKRNQKLLAAEEAKGLVPNGEGPPAKRSLALSAKRKDGDSQLHAGDSSLAPLQPDNIRVVLIIENRVCQVYESQQSILQIPLERLLQHQLSDGYLRAEEIPPDERAGNTIWLHRGHHETPRWLVTHPEPFSMSLIPMETVADFKKRLQARVHMPDTQFAAVKLQLETRSSHSPAWNPSYDFVDLTDDVVVSELGLDLSVRRILFCFKPRQLVSRETYFSSLDKPVKIYT